MAYSESEKQYARSPEHRKCIRACRKGFTRGYSYCQRGLPMESPWDGEKGNQDGYYCEYMNFYVGYKQAQLDTEESPEARRNKANQIIQKLGKTK